MPKNIAIILASGSGVRFGSDRPKQFIKLAGKTIIEHTLDQFESHGQIDEIIIMVSEKYKYLIEEIIIDANYKKVKEILIGGDTRQESTCIGINSIDGESHKVLVHDAVRPLLDTKIITECLMALDECDCIDTVISSPDTIVQSEDGTYISQIPKRSLLRLGQTPQGFKSGLLKTAHKLAKEHHFIATDDCGLVLEYHLSKVKLVNGSPNNIKVTHPLDIYIADRLFQLKANSSEKDQLNGDVKDKVIVIFGGSQGIGASIAKIGQDNGAKVYATSRSQGVDVRKEIDVAAYLKQIYATEGRIDIVINTAGILKNSLLSGQSYHEIHELININLLGSIVVAKESFEFLKECNGRIVLFTSSSYTRGRARTAIYSATKAAIVNLAQGLAQEYNHFNVKINVINPERTLTPMRVKNFGNESAETLLNAGQVAIATLNTLFEDTTGEVIDVRL